MSVESLQLSVFIASWKTTSSGRGQISLAMPGNTTREYWSIGMKAEDYDVFLFLYLALLHYSITPLFQKDPEITVITNPLWG